MYRSALIITFFVLLYTIYLPRRQAGNILYTPSVFAETLENSNYQLQIDQITTKDTQLSTPSEEKPPEVTQEKISAPIGIAVSQKSLDFGELSPTNLIVRSFTLQTLGKESVETSVFAFEDHELSSGSALIPDTACDNGMCTESAASTWTNLLSYGFGYHCDNVVQASCIGFQMPDSFKRFANASHSKPWEIISQTTGSAKSRISLKLNISGTQEKTLYKNAVTLIAIPSY